MTNLQPVRKILIGSKEFKQFWQNSDPFQFALTSNEFPPVLLEPEEWIFSNDLTCLLKELMQYHPNKMKIVPAPFNPENKNVLRPENLSNWKIHNFPEQWNAAVCDLFTPEGHLTDVVIKSAGKAENKMDAKSVEQAFFKCLETALVQLGYLLFKAQKGSKRAAVQSYLAEWEKDEQDAGLM